MIVAVMLAGSAVALVSRSDAGLSLAVAGLAAWLFTGGYRIPFRRWSLLVAGIACVGIVATFLGRQNERWAGGLDVQEDQTRTALLFEGILDLPRRVLGSIGLSELGWLDTPMPALVGTLMLLAFGGVLAIGLGAATREKWLALAVVGGALIALPLLVLSSGQNVQPRYVLPLLPVLMGTALITRPVDPPVRLRRSHALLIVLAVVVAHGAALHRNIRRYVTGVDVGGPDLDASIELVESRAWPDGHLGSRHCRVRSCRRLRVPPDRCARRGGRAFAHDAVAPFQLSANRAAGSSASSLPVYV